MKELFYEVKFKVQWKQKHQKHLNATLYNGQPNHQNLYILLESVVVFNKLAIVQRWVAPKLIIFKDQGLVSAHGGVWFSFGSVLWAYLKKMPKLGQDQGLGGGVANHYWTII